MFSFTGINGFLLLKVSYGIRIFVNAVIMLIGKTAMEKGLYGSLFDVESENLAVLKSDRGGELLF